MAKTLRQQFVDKIAPAAQAACKGTGLFPSLMIAQAIVESGDGQSALCLKDNNYFGIKADASWKGAKTNYPTREVIKGRSVTINAYFRSYPTMLEGFKDRNRFLKENPRYAKAGVFTAGSPEAQAYAFQLAGYATDPNYAATLSAIMNGSGQLKQFDKI